MPAAEIKGLVTATGLSHVIACSLDTGNRGFILAFVERWHKEMSNFHLSVGEVTITLDDVAFLLHLPIIGTFHSFDILHVDEVVLMLVELLKVIRDEARAETGATHVHVVFLDAFRDLSQSGSYEWGVTALVHMYDNLNYACKSGDKQLVGYITLLQDFSSIVEAFTDSDYDERSPRACHWTSTKALPASTYRKHLDRLTVADVCWMPYGDHRAV
ncbi:protein MAIN-LIKE 1-like [Glycine max]|uniref:protein MAIN-LIKE 1-like n=1 Tax=Glycine max TaxID=3847 RepID=UPI0003DE91A5|nr:protein MAIN-LIKE 1-like [Glycine max]|eukprot:XP_006576062.1 protein MAIN-LIKE 1-like [Glycine max]